jgi:hypothetical protein
MMYQPAYSPPFGSGNRAPVPAYPMTPQPGYPMTNNPSVPAQPTGPVVLNPAGPSSPGGPNTVPISTPGNQPVPIPTNPSTPSTPSTPSNPGGDVHAQWASWPLPPKGNAAIAQVQPYPGQNVRSASKLPRGTRRPRQNATHPGSTAEQISLATAGLSANSRQIVAGATPTPAQDLHYRGGKTLQNMSYMNLYVSGEQGWSMSDVNNIDNALSAAMNDVNLNNVLRQYFNNQLIGTAVLPSHPLVGYIPKEAGRDDIEAFVKYLYQQGYLSKYDLSATVFNFLLPPGCVLSDDDDGSGATTATASDGDQDRQRPIGMVNEEDDEAVDSTGGLGGYHGSIHIGAQTIYYAAIVFSERRANGFQNGIPAFTDGWKNVVATTYHELQEARTDPDVEDVINNPYDPNAVRKLGWTSDAGEEIGDFPLHDNVSIHTIIQEVPLTDGSGTVPIQLLYSNGAHGPEGPIAKPYATPAR